MFVTFVQHPRASLHSSLSEPLFTGFIKSVQIFPRRSEGFIVLHWPRKGFSKDSVDHDLRERQRCSTILQDSERLHRLRLGVKDGTSFRSQS